MLSPEQRTRIESALSDLLNECCATDRPYSRVSAFIAELLGNSNWNEREIIELQTLAIRVLLYRHGRPVEGDAH
jgi:hypothetical protein